MTWVAVGITTVSTLYTAGEQSRAQQAQAGQQRVAGMQAQVEGAMDKAMRDMEANDVTTAAAKEADQIKRQAMVMRGTIVQAQSGSGVMIGEGSAQAALDQLDTLSSADAMAALYSGTNKSASIRASGRFAMTAGTNKNASSNAAATSLQNASNATMIGGLLSAGGGLAKGYNTPAPTATPMGDQYR